MWNEEEWMKEFERKRNEPFVMVRHKDLYLPGALSKGDHIGIVSLSGYDPEEVMGVMAIISSHGYVPVLSEAVQNSYPESEIIPRGERISELYYMVEDPKIKAIFCCGDGSGSMETLPNFSYGPIARNPKWLVGNGDVTALLSMWVISDIAAIHGTMCSGIIEGSQSVETLFNLLATGGKIDYTLPVSPHDYRGKASGRLIGGNLSAITRLGGTSYDFISRFLDIDSNDRGVILFFEDSGISLAKVRDMLLRFYLIGPLFSVKGLIFGSFVNCKPYSDLCSIQDVVAELQERWMIPPDIPIAFEFPIGKETPNIPLVEGLEVEFEVTEEFVTLRSLKN